VDYQCGFCCNRSILDQIFFFCVCQILEKNWEYNEAVHLVFVDCKKTYDSIRREVLYNILIKFGVLMKLVMLITIYLNETYNKVHIGKYFFYNFIIQNGLTQDALSPLLF
jgi:hypothetical protein